MAARRRHDRRRQHNDESEEELPSTSGGNSSRSGNAALALREQRSTYSGFSSSSDEDSDPDLQISDAESDSELDIYWLDRHTLWTDDLKEDAMSIFFTPWKIMRTPTPHEIDIAMNRYGSRSSQIRMYMTWPVGPKWEELPAPPRAPIIFASLHIVSTAAVSAAGYLMKTMMCRPFAITAHRDNITVENVQLFLSDAFARILTNVHTTAARYSTLTREHPYSSNPDNFIWHAIFNQLVFNGIRLDALHLPDDMRMEDNVERGSLASKLRNAGTALFTWPVICAAIPIYQHRNTQVSLVSLDAMEIVMMASFPIAWKDVPVAKLMDFCPALEQLASYFLITVAFTENLVGSLYAFSSTIIRLLLDNTITTPAQNLFGPVEKSWFIDGVEGHIINELTTSNLAIATACANTYASLRSVLASEINFLNVRFYQKARFNRETDNPMPFVRIFQDFSVFIMLLVHRLAAHLNIVYAILETAATHGVPDFRLRRSAVVIYDKLSEIIAPLYARLSSADLMALGMDALHTGGITQDVNYVRHVPQTVQTYRLELTTQAISLRYARSVTNPMIDRPVAAGTIFGRRIARPRSSKRGRYVTYAKKEQPRKVLYSLWSNDKR